MSTAL